MEEIFCSYLKLLRNTIDFACKSDNKNICQLIYMFAIKHLKTNQFSKKYFPKKKEKSENFFKETEFKSYFNPNPLIVNIKIMSPIFCVSFCILPITTCHLFLYKYMTYHNQWNIYIETQKVKQKICIPSKFKLHFMGGNRMPYLNIFINTNMVLLPHGEHIPVHIIKGSDC